MLVQSNNPPSQHLTKHIPALDGLRGLAILLVLLVHFGSDVGVGHATGISGVLQDLPQSGWIGVDLFFVLSGFLITGILLDSKGTSYYFRNFYVRRVLRIFPLYYGVLAFLFLILPNVHSFDYSVMRPIAKEQFWIWFYGSNILFAWKGFFGYPVVNHFWSLAIEEQFYFLWPMVIVTFSRKVLLLVCAAVIISAFALRVGFVLGNFSPVAIYVLTPFRIDSLALGAALALFARDVRNLTLIQKAAPWVLVACLAVMVAWIFWSGQWNLTDRFVQTFGFSANAFASASLLVLAIAPSPNVISSLFSSSVLKFFGKYSYGLYVLHQSSRPFMSRALELLAVKIGVVHFPIVVTALFPLMTSIILAWLSWHLFERHFLGLKKYFASREHPAGGVRESKIEYAVTLTDTPVTLAPNHKIGSRAK